MALQLEKLPVKVELLERQGVQEKGEQKGLALVTGQENRSFLQEESRKRTVVKKIFEVNIQILGIRTLNQVKQNARWVKYLGPEGQIGNFKSHVANRAMNL